MGIVSWIFGQSPDNPGVYRIRNKVTNTEYIGATTKTIRFRWGQHIANLNFRRHKNRRLQADWITYGPDAFEFSVIEIIHNPDRVFERERYWQDRGYEREQRYNPRNEDVPRTYSAQGKRDFSIFLPSWVSSVEELIEYATNNPLTGEQLYDVLSGIRRNGEPLMSNEEIRALCFPKPTRRMKRPQGGW